MLVELKDIINMKKKKSLALTQNDETHILLIEIFGKKIKRMIILRKTTLPLFKNILRTPNKKNIIYTGRI